MWQLTGRSRLNQYREENEDVADHFEHASFAAPFLLSPPSLTPVFLSSPTSLPPPSCSYQPSSSFLLPLDSSSSLLSRSYTLTEQRSRRSCCQTSSSSLRTHDDTCSCFPSPPCSCSCCLTRSAPAASLLLTFAPPSSPPHPSSVQITFYSLWPLFPLPLFLPPLFSFSHRHSSRRPAIVEETST